MPLARRASAVWLLCGLIASGCSGINPVPPPTENAPFVYRVGPGDTLSVEVRNEPGLEMREVTVTPDGHISFPLVRGTISVQNLTIREIAEALRSELLFAIREPVVTVSLLQFSSVQVLVLGEVSTQGRVPFQDDLSVMQAIGASGGPNWSTANMSSVRVVRAVLDDPVLFEINVKKLLLGKVEDIFLVPGDIVVVPAKGVTRFARYIEQLLAPLGIVAGTAGTASRSFVGGGL